MLVIVNDQTWYNAFPTTSFYGFLIEKENWLFYFGRKWDDKYGQTIRCWCFMKRIKVIQTWIMDYSSLEWLSLKLIKFKFCVQRDHISFICWQYVRSWFFKNLKYTSLKNGNVINSKHFITWFLVRTENVYLHLVCNTPPMSTLHGRKWWRMAWKLLYVCRLIIGWGHFHLLQLKLYYSFTVASPHPHSQSRSSIHHTDIE